MKKNNFSLLFTLLFIFTINNLLAQEDSTLTREETIARALSNPAASLGSLNLLNDFTLYGGSLNNANSQQAAVISFQPNLPYPIAEGTNLYLRPLIPFVVSSPIFNETSGEFESFGGIGDISFDIILGKTWKNGLVTLGGVFGKIPTATKSELGSGQFSLGPNFLLGKASHWGFIGALIAHSWSVTNPDKGKTSITSGQYYYTIKIKNAWQLSSQPTYSFNHNAAEGNKFTFPIGTGLANTFLVGKIPVRLRFEYWHYVAKADSFGPKNQFRLVITPVVPLPWKAKK